MTGITWVPPINQYSVGVGTLSYIDPWTGSSGSVHIDGGSDGIETDYEGIDATYISAAFTIKSGAPQYFCLGINAGDNNSWSVSTGQLFNLFPIFDGDFGTGTFTHSGGTVTVPLFLGLGVGAGGSGTYYLSNNGCLSAPTEYVGGNGRGSFIQQGGSNTITGLNSSGGTGGLSLVMGFGIGGSGTYNLSGGSLFAPTEYVGYSGTGSVMQWPGTTHSITYVLALGQNAGSSGSYYLYGGNLSANSEWIGCAGSGSFTQQGGTNSNSGPGSYLYVGRTAAAAAHTTSSPAPSYGREASTSATPAAAASRRRAGPIRRSPFSLPTTAAATDGIP